MPRSVISRSILEGEYEIDRILGMRAAHGGREFLVRWVGYTHYGDTWEPEDHIKPRSKVVSFLSRPGVTVDLEYPVWLVRDAVARQCTAAKISDRGAVWRRRVPVPGLAIPEVGRAVLEHFRRLFSPRVPLDRDGGDTSVTFDQLDQLSEVVGFHIPRPEERAIGTGCLRIRTGAATYEDLMSVFELTLRYHEPAERNGAPAMGGRFFEIELSTVVFEGKSGQPHWPAMPDGWELDKDGNRVNYDQDEDLRLSDEEKSVIVTHAKEELRQRWAVTPITHGLLKKGWHNLPRNVWSLPQRIANPVKPRPKPKPQPRAIAKQRVWRDRDERLQARGRVLARMFK